MYKIGEKVFVSDDYGKYLGTVTAFRDDLYKVEYDDGGYDWLLYEECQPVTPHIKPKVYVVISDAIIQGHTSNGLHGVYSSKAKARSVAMSAIISMAKGQYHNISESDICEHDELELSYQSGNVDIFVSCLEQEVM